MRFFDRIEQARFLNRPNRFLVGCLKGRGEIKAFLPNPGRLQELLLPGVLLYLVESPTSAQRCYPYTVVAVERDGIPVMLHTHKTNEVAAYLLDQGKIPGLEGARVIGREIPVGHSRFDLLVEHEREEILVEVKSCTLAGEKTAMFPDALTERGSRHLRELAELSREGRKTAVLFVIHWPKAGFFLPDYHTDLVFARTMVACRDQVRFFPVRVRWKKDLSLDDQVKLLTIPWETIEKEAQDRGSYLLILRVPERKTIPIGKLGKITFRAGYYIYVGSAMANLTARVERHRRLRKNLHWHIDYLRAAADFISVLPIRASVSLECVLAGKMEKITEWTVPGFGSSDCLCPSHLFALASNPFLSQDFLDVIQYFRMDRLFNTTNHLTT